MGFRFETNTPVQFFLKKCAFIKNKVFMAFLQADNICVCIWGSDKTVIQNFEGITMFLILNITVPVHEVNLWIIWLLFVSVWINREKNLLRMSLQHPTKRLRKQHTCVNTMKNASIFLSSWNPRALDQTESRRPRESQMKKGVM